MKIVVSEQFANHTDGQTVWINPGLFAFLTEKIVGKFPKPQIDRQRVKVLTRLGLTETIMLMGGNQPWTVVPTAACEAALKAMGIVEGDTQ